MTRQLGFQYLWIDSLCIVQDSAEDWQCESSRMATIYASSMLTLSASVSTSDDVGFLHARSLEGQQSVSLPYRLNGETQGSYFLSNRSPSDFDDDATMGALNKRAWTLQERFLSRRSLFFGRDQHHWECQTSRFSECHGFREQ